MSKHAYLIMAHKGWDQLARLIHLLDDTDNDIYIHIDKNANNVNFENIEKQAIYSHILVISEISICWGSDSIMNCEMMLLKRAAERHYAYYHLLSGADLLLKPQNEIHDFFDKNAGREFIHFYSGPISIDNPIFDRVKLYHYFQSKNIFMKGLDKVTCYIQKILGVNRWSGEKRELLYGANWFSITDDLAQYVISQESWIKKRFSYTHCCDELFLQTIVYNSKFKQKLYQCNFCNDYVSNMRYIKWDSSNGKTSHPVTLTMKDYDCMHESGRLFARKFDADVDVSIIDKLYNECNMEFIR